MIKIGSKVECDLGVTGYVIDIDEQSLGCVVEFDNGVVTWVEIDSLTLIENGQFN